MERIKMQEELQKEEEKKEGAIKIIKWEIYPKHSNMVIIIMSTNDIICLAQLNQENRLQQLKQ